MPSPNTKYSAEIKEQSAEFILSSGKSATSVAEEMGIDTNTVCKWVCEYRKHHELSSYAEEKGFRTRNPGSRPECHAGARSWRTAGARVLAAGGRVGEPTGFRRRLCA